jgi:hypothetical protein
MILKTKVLNIDPHYQAIKLMRVLSRVIHNQPSSVDPT